MKRLVFVLSSLILSCSPESQPSNTMDAKRFEEVYIELLDSSAVAQPAPSDSVLSPTAERILRRHQVDIEMFRSTLKVYNEDSQRWRAFFENVVRRYEQRRQKTE